MDQMHRDTDKRITTLERRVKEVYSVARGDLQRKMDVFIDGFKSKDAIMQKKLKDGEITEDQYKRWLSGQVFQGKQWKYKVDQMTKSMSEYNKIAQGIINGQVDGVFANNANWQSYVLEHKAGLDLGFGVYDANTVARLLRDEPNLLPKSKVNVPKDRAWNQKVITQQVTQGIIQGERLEQVAKRISDVTDRNKNLSLTRARTAMTGAQNAGRQESLNRAAKMGIEVKKQWLATLDEHTRTSHASMDGQSVEIGKPFHYQGYRIMYPGDPHAHPSMVYNCRCTMIGDYVKYPSMDSERYDNIDGKPIKDMTYQEWKSAKSIPKHRTINGNDILDMWHRRKSEFDFEIEDVINAQGFDGLPLVVSEKEFDSAVRNSGFIAQRTYSANSQEILDAYRDQLYNGKWYVDCSTGGAQYGQGMYCASDWNGKLTNGIKLEMDHYAEVGKNRGNSFSYVETFTLSKDAKVVKYNDLFDEFSGYRATVVNNNKISYLTERFKEIGIPQSYMDDALTMAKNELGIISAIDSDNFDIISNANYRLHEKGLRKTAFDVVIEARKKSAQFEEGVYQFDDIGSFAAARGYDVINAEGHGESGSYTVILNRTKLIIKGEG